MARKTEQGDVVIRLQESLGATYENYQAFNRVTDYPSEGKATRLFSPKFNIHIDLFSNLKKYVFLILEHDASVYEVRPKYPLVGRLPEPVPDREEILELSELKATKSIAAALGYKHPVLPGTGIDKVMTCDFLATKLAPDGSRKYIAYYVAPYAKTQSKRQQEKLQIQKKHWDLLGTEFKIVTEKAVSRTLADNLSRLRKLPPLPEDLMLLIPDYARCFEVLEGLSIMEISRIFEEENNLFPGDGVKLFWNCVKFNILEIDLRKPVNLYLRKAGAAA